MSEFESKYIWADKLTLDQSPDVPCEDLLVRRYDHDALARMVEDEVMRALRWVAAKYAIRLPYRDRKRAYRRNRWRMR